MLSGGQRKRVNIALELISDTPVLFLDEPTSGLSSYDAAGVVDLLKRLSQAGKTIVATIHQPSIDVFRKFDNLIMISRDSGGSGALVYFGPAYPDSIQFFRETPAGHRGSRAGRRASSRRLESRDAADGPGERADPRVVGAICAVTLPEAVRRRPRGARPSHLATRRIASASRRFDFRQWLTLVAAQPDSESARSRAARHPAAAGAAVRHADRARLRRA